jgi:hypothetical protein
LAGILATCGIYQEMEIFLKCVVITWNSSRRIWNVILRIVSLWNLHRTFF